MVADRRYGSVDQVQTTVSQQLLSFEFEGKSLTTRPEAMAYVYRLDGLERAWQSTYSWRVEYQNLPQGEYEFIVKAVDQDLNYSEPVRVKVSVAADRRDEQIDELERRVRDRTQELVQTHRQLEATQAQLITKLERELQTARELQMGLMPEGAPRIEGIDIAAAACPPPMWAAIFSSTSPGSTT